MAKLAVVILHYGDPLVTTKVHLQLKQSDPDLTSHLFVLDNGAPKAYQQSWLRLPENLYWAGALSYSLEYFHTKGYSHLWFLNNDCYFLSQPPIISKAWARLQAIETKVGPVAVYSPATTINPYHPQMIQNPELQFRLTQYLDGIAPLINLDFSKEAGGLDCQGNHYGYGVEIAFSSKANTLGWKLVVDHQMLIRHVYHTTAGQEPGFLQEASIAEKAYLTRVFGKDYKTHIHNLSQQNQDIRSLSEV